MRPATALGLAMILAAGAALAEGTRTVPEAVARAGLMEDIGRNMKVLGGMAEGKAAFDAAAAAAARDALVADTGKIEATFTTAGADDPASEARPEIWTDWNGFLARAGALKTAAEGLDAATLESLQAGLGSVGATCKGCHTNYRE